MMALNQWSRRSLMLLAAIFAVGGFLIGSSSGQNAKRGAAESEVGRYQIVAGKINLTVFDTKTAHIWQLSLDDPDKWDEIPGPFGKAK